MEGACAQPVGGDAEDGEAGGDPLLQFLGGVGVECEREDAVSRHETPRDGVGRPGDMTDVFPEPAAAMTRTRLSKETTAEACSAVSGDFSILSKNGFPSLSSRRRISSLADATRAQ